MHAHYAATALSASALTTMRSHTAAQLALHRYVIPWLLAIWSIVLAVSCQASEQIVDHSFEFDALRDSPGVQILDFRYGESTNPGTRNPAYLLRQGRSLQRTSTTGPMERADSLYVKWRVIDENRTYEETVDLRKRLPKDLTDWKVYFVVQGSQLHVYLVSREPRKSGAVPVGPARYQDRTVLTIYP